MMMISQTIRNNLNCQSSTLAIPPRLELVKRNLKIQEREAQRFWDLVFSTRPGRREMWKLLRDCAAFEDKFACGPNGFPQPDASWFHAGVASWGQRMSQTWLINHTAEFALMLKENDPRFQKDSK